MIRFNKNFLDFVILVIFFIWGVFDLFSLAPNYQFIIDLICSIIFVVLFEFSLKSTEDRNSRYKSLVKSIFLFSAILIAVTVIIDYRNLPFSISGLEVVNIVLPIQSIMYLYYYSRNNK